MAKALHAFDYLSAIDDHAPQPVNVVFGDESFLKRHVLSNLKKQALGTSDADFSLTVFEGKQAELADVLDELSTMAMFGGSSRLVLIEEADDFVSRYRPELEDYVGAPRPTGKADPGNEELAGEYADFQGGCREGADCRLFRAKGRSDSEMAEELGEEDP